MKRVPAYEKKNYEATEVVKVRDGDLTGVVIEDGEAEIFAGIPYAKAPVGELRWKAPEDPEPWDGILKADTFAPMNYQPRNLPIYYSLYQIIGFHDYKWLDMKDNYQPAVSEDGLYLNLWRPAG
ncbi:MAG: carboxylesterase family protein, partial [Lachnospiraceae bacterium]|nr:carboxylesterase family protein [Lachnospiraceae bacterium]